MAWCHVSMVSRLQTHFGLLPLPQDLPGRKQVHTQTMINSHPCSVNLRLVGLLCRYLGDKENKLCSQKYSPRSNRKILFATIILFSWIKPSSETCWKLFQPVFIYLQQPQSIFPWEEKASFKILSGNYPHCALCRLKNNTLRKLRQEQEETDMASLLLNSPIAPQIPPKVVACST